MRKPPNERISEFAGPGETPVVVLSAFRVLPLVFFWVLVFVVPQVSTRLVDSLATGVALMLVLLTPLVTVRWFYGRYTIGVVEGDVIVVQDGGYWGWPTGRLVGRWKPTQGVLQLREGRVARLHIAGARYTVRGDQIPRARLAVASVDNRSNTVLHP